MSVSRVAFVLMAIATCQSVSALRIAAFDDAACAGNYASSVLVNNNTCTVVTLPNNEPFYFKGGCNGNVATIFYYNTSACVESANMTDFTSNLDSKVCKPQNGGAFWASCDDAKPTTGTEVIAPTTPAPTTPAPTTPAPTGPTTAAPTTTPAPKSGASTVTAPMTLVAAVLAIAAIRL